MITLLKSEPNGVCEWSISTIDELDKLNKEAVSPTSTATLVDDNGMRLFVLNGDKTKWVEL